MQLDTDILDRMIDELKPHWTRDKLRELDVRFWMSPEYEYEHSHYDGFIVHKSPLLKGEYIYFATELKFLAHFLS
jgi:hypothetical protein